MKFEIDRLAGQGFQSVFQQYFAFKRHFVRCFYSIQQKSTGIGQLGRHVTAHVGAERKCARDCATSALLRRCKSRAGVWGRPSKFDVAIRRSAKVGQRCLRDFLLNYGHDNSSPRIAGRACPAIRLRD